MEVLQAIQAWANAHAFLGSTVVAFCVALFSVWLARDIYGAPPLNEQLQDHENLEKLTRTWAADTHNAYVAAVDDLQHWSGDFYGPRLSLRALNRCLQLAFFYPFVALFHGWILSNLHSRAVLQLSKIRQVSCLGFGVVLWLVLALVWRRGSRPMHKGLQIGVLRRC